jgi:hypothetical protein
MVHGVTKSVVGFGCGLSVPGEGGSPCVGHLVPSMMVLRWWNHKEVGLVWGGVEVTGVLCWEELM